MTLGERGLSTIANGRGCPRSSCPSGWVSPANRFPSGSGMNPCQRRTSCRCLPKTLGVSLDALLSGGGGGPAPAAGPTPAKGGAVGKLVWLFRRWAGWAACWRAGAATFGRLAGPLPHGGRCSRPGELLSRCARPLWGFKSSPWPILVGGGAQPL